MGHITSLPISLFECYTHDVCQLIRLVLDQAPIAAAVLGVFSFRKQ